MTPDEEAELATIRASAAAGMRTFTLFRWSMNEGRVSISIDLSERSVRLE